MEDSVALHVALVERQDDADAVRKVDYEPILIERNGPPISEATARALQYSTVVLMPRSDTSAMIEAGRLLYDANADAPPEVRLMPEWPSWVARTPRNLLDALLAAPLWERPRSDPSAWTLADLMRAKFKPVSWLVENLLPEVGFVLLAGREKWGKSWLTLQLAVAVAAGGVFLGRRCTAGRVIVLALEDTPQRLQERLRLQQALDYALPLTFRTDFPALDEDGLDALRQLVIAERPKLLVIDTLTASLSGRLDEDSARELGPLGKALRKLAQEFGLTILLIHHHHKGESRDVGADARGSSTLPASADTVIGVYEKDGASRLAAKGRDIGRTELPLRFDSGSTFCWQLREDTRAETRDATDEKAVAALQSLGGSGDADQVADKLGWTRSWAVRVLGRLESQGRVRPAHDGNRVVFELTDQGPERIGEHPEHREQASGGSVPGVRGVPGSAADIGKLWPDAEPVADDAAGLDAEHPEAQP